MVIVLSMMNFVQMHTVSFYRRQHKNDKTGSNLEKIVFAGASTSSQSRDVGSQLNRLKSTDEAVSVQNMIVSCF